MSPIPLPKSYSRQAAPYRDTSKIVKVQRRLRDYGTGAWHGGDPACPHPLGRTRRADGIACPACQARWVDPQYGLETTLDNYLDHLVAVFDQARRILTPTGTCWVNLGDSYSAGNKLAYDTTSGITGSRQLPDNRRAAPLPPKNLLGVPWRAAFAIQASGWILRNAVVWSKTNPMPESVRDRLSATYELLFLFTRSPKYFFDLDPIRIPLARPDAADGTRVIGGIHKGRAGGVGATGRRRGASIYGVAAGKHAAHLGAGAGSGNLRPVGHAHTATHAAGRNPGDVWRIATRPYHGSHVAPFPLDLPLRTITAGCPPRRSRPRPVLRGRHHRIGRGAARAAVRRHRRQRRVPRRDADPARSAPARHRNRAGVGMSASLRTVPVTFAQARQFVADWHRHHRPPRGHKFSIGVADGEVLVGVAIVGRPVARHLDDGLTLPATPDIRTCGIGRRSFLAYIA